MPREATARSLRSNVLEQPRARATGEKRKLMNGLNESAKK